MAAHASIAATRHLRTMLLRRATTRALTARRLSTKREYDLVLFGATGYSGRMCADYLLRTHKGLRVALAGRDRAKSRRSPGLRYTTNRPRTRRTLTLTKISSIHGGRGVDRGALPQVRVVVSGSLC